MRVLNRIVRIVPEGLVYGPDPRHIELLAKGMNLDMAQSNSRVTPGSRPRIEEQEQAEDERTIDEIISSIRMVKKSSFKVAFCW